MVGDASFTMDNPKKRREFDRISSLPDNTLHHILSFLPTKYAVGSSVLSTRWKHLWRSSNNLDFDDKLTYSGCESKNYSKRKKMFIDFVDRVLELNDVLSIQKVILRWKVCNVAHFNEWISNIMRRKVQELVISITNHIPTLYPRCPWLFTSNSSLRILKLDMKDRILVPAVFCFSSLEVLHLRNITFYGDQPMYDVSLSFPNLVDCLLETCSWEEIKTVNISAPTLEVLDICDWREAALWDCVIKIHAANLTSLRFRTTPVHEYSFLDVSSLVYVVIDLSRHNKDVHRVVSLVKGLLNVRDLSVYASCIESLSASAVVPHLQPLSRLMHLRVLQGYNLTVQKLIDFLCYVPNIESLSFPEGLEDMFTFKGQGGLLEETPQSFLSSLKFIEIAMFNWNRRQRWFVKYLMKSITNMNTLNIRLQKYPSDSSLEWKEEVTEDLEVVAKASNCVLVYFEES
ncbi:hypothetical protein ACHQM5_021908 [Ranunculus cassubicifolius]